MSVWIGGATLAITAAGTAYSIYNSERQNRAAGGGGMSDKKWIKRANQVSDQSYQMAQKQIGDLLKRVDIANTTYRTNVAAFSNDFNQKMGVAQTDFKTTSDQAIQNQQGVNAEFLRKSDALPTEAYSEALDWNTANQSRIFAFADALQASSTRASFDSAMSINPQMRGVLDQLTLNAQADSRGILSADVASQVARGSAQAAIGSGVQGQMRENLTLRDLGLTSMGRKDAAVANTAALFQSVYNPILERGKIDYDGTVKSFQANGDNILSNRATLLDSWKNTGIGIEDNRRIDGGRLLQSREMQYTYDYGQKATMEGNIYDGSVHTYNNAASLGVNSAISWGNQRLGIQSQGWANQQAAQTAAGQNQAAIASSAMSSLATLGGAYYAANKKPATPTPAPSGGTTSGT